MKSLVYRILLLSTICSYTYADGLNQTSFCMADSLETKNICIEGLKIRNLSNKEQALRCHDLTDAKFLDCFDWDEALFLKTFEKDKNINPSFLEFPNSDKMIDCASKFIDGLRKCKITSNENDATSQEEKDCRIKIIRDFDICGQRLNIPIMPAPPNETPLFIKPVSTDSNIKSGDSIWVYWGKNTYDLPEGWMFGVAKDIKDQEVFVTFPGYDKKLEHWESMDNVKSYLSIKSSDQMTYRTPKDYKKIKNYGYVFGVLLDVQSKIEEKVEQGVKLEDINSLQDLGMNPSEVLLIEGDKLIINKGVIEMVPIDIEPFKLVPMVDLQKQVLWSCESDDKALLELSPNLCRRLQ